LTLRSHSHHALTSLLLVVSLCLSACGPEAENEAPEQERTKKVLLIGIDGVRPDVLASVATPNIDALISEGAFTDQARTGFPSVSGPGWSSMLNGVWPEKHGVTGNSFDNDHFKEYPDFLTRIEQLRPELETFAVVDWAPLGQSEDQRHTISDIVDTKIVVDGYEYGWAEADSMSVQRAVDALTNGDPDALFVYLGNPDETSHENASIGDEYRSAIALSDHHVGLLVAAVKARLSYTSEDWLILSSTDHGRTEEGGHGGDSDEERTIFYLASGPSAARGALTDSTFVVDIPVTALTHLGIDIDPTWSLDGRPAGLIR
jgi:predicted AlkP superfamily pyrophosphatase or phosphodiesterase